jgi:uncharacterized protein (TIGR00297 family)
MNYEPINFIILTSYFLLSYALAAAIGYAGYRARALTAGGAVAACLVGGTVFAFGGLGWALLLVLFFVSSSALSFVGASDPRKERAAETFDKGGRRDAAQVLANGGVAALAALLSQLVEPRLAPLFFGAFTGALAAATADTWATEAGVLSNRTPRLITTGRPVPPGTSGGVTLLGTGAAATGALLIGVAAVLLSPITNLAIPPVPFIGSVLFAAAGLAGSVLDSALGATAQASYVCPRCEKPTESRLHRCGTTTTLARGVPWITNDLVNLAATAAGALVGGIVAASVV